MEKKYILSIDSGGTNIRAFLFNKQGEIIEREVEKTPPLTLEEGAIEHNVNIFKDLQKLEGVGLVIPVGEEHMYFAAKNSKSCRLTALGYQYWRLANEKKI